MAGDVMAKGSANNFRRKIRFRAYDFARTRTCPAPHADLTPTNDLIRSSGLSTPSSKSACHPTETTFASLSVEYQSRTRLALRFGPSVSHFHNKNLIPRPVGNPIVARRTFGCRTHRFIVNGDRINVCVTRPMVYNNYQY